jgi:glycosyltransferase involved in cell wall biosynthesis
MILLLRHVRRGNLVIVGTNPPTLPFSVAFACWAKRADCLLKAEDIYPDNMIAARIISQHGFVARLMNFAQRRLLLRMKAIFVLGRDMEALVQKKLAPNQVRLEWVPNWADSDVIKPEARGFNRLIQELGLQDKFIVGYAGNIGPLQGIECLFDCALRMREHTDVHFLFVGQGQRYAWLNRAVCSAGLKNVTLLGQRPRSDQAVFLNAFDVAVVSLITGMSGVGVPSRTYNFLAAGKPVLAAVDADSEIAALVNEESVGWVVTPGKVDEFVSVVLAAKSNPDQLKQIGCRARQLAESKYSFENVMKQYRALLKGYDHSEQTLEPRHER